MRSLVATAALLLTLGPATAQRPGTWRCAHLLAEDGRTWRDNVIVTTILDSIVSIRPDDGRDVDRDLGVIRPGARCGLVALGGNPFEDIRNVRRVRAVIREGDELERRGW